MKNILLVSLMLASPAVNAASFDCQKAGTAVEHKICDNQSLSSLDEQLSKIYNNALKSNPTSATEIKSVQRQWIGMRNKLTTDVELDMAYSIQIAGMKQISENVGSTVSASEVKNVVQAKETPTAEKSTSINKSDKPKNKLTLESFKENYVEIDGDYFSTVKTSKGTPFLMNCASRMANDIVNLWKKEAVKNNQMDLFFDVEDRIHTAATNRSYSTLTKDLSKTGICDLLNSAP